MNYEKQKLVVFGKNGQVAKALAKEILEHAVFGLWESNFFGSNEVSFENPVQVLQVLEQLNPTVVINAAAYTAVDLAETEKEKALKINAETPAEIAKWCKKNGAVLIHYSSDYVYEGLGIEPHQENEKHSPQSHYGFTKSQGDEEIIKSGCKHLIFRTSWVYFEQGKNFVVTMLKLSEKPELKIVSDQVGSPTYAKDIARATLKALDISLRAAKFPSGIYHLTNEGFTSWADFAKQIFSKAKEVELIQQEPKVIAIPSSEYPTPAKRPLNSRLDTKKIREAFGVDLRPWNEALTEMLNKLNATELGVKK